MESIQIYLNSKEADKYVNDSLSECEFYLPLIEIPDGFYIYISVVNCVIPYSFYNVSSSNNLLVYSLDSMTMVNVTLPVGNYNINQIVTALRSLMAGFTVTYDNVANKLTFSYPYDFMFFDSSTCMQLLGFLDNKTYIATNNSLTSEKCVDVYTIKNIQIHSNLLTYNIDKNQRSNLSILCSVPVTNQPFSLINYVNSNNFRTNLFINQINVIKIKLTDEAGKLINLNGCYFTITLQLDVESFRD